MSKDMLDSANQKIVLHKAMLSTGSGLGKPVPVISALLVDQDQKRFRLYLDVVKAKELRDELDEFIRDTEPAVPHNAISDR